MGGRGVLAGRGGGLTRWKNVVKKHEKKLAFFGEI